MSLCLRLEDNVITVGGPDVYLEKKYAGEDLRLKRHHGEDLVSF